MKRDGSRHKVQAKGERFWRAVVKATSIAWNIITPIVGGALLGRYIDDRMGGEYKYMWTITLLVGGTFIAFYNLYQMLFKEG